MNNKERVQLEYAFNSSLKVLYDRLSTPSGLSEWFADDVNIQGNVLTFIWNNSEQKAEILSKKENKFARYRWLEDDEEYFFEFKLSTHELTNEVTLVVVDFAHPGEMEESKELWDSQISELKRILGN